MLCLAIDASGAAGSVALIKDNALLYETVLVKERAHAALLAPMVDQALQLCSYTVEDCDVVACVVGPGSFTGVRIGTALAQGLAFAADKLCAPINALETLAHAQVGFNDWVCPILDARGGQVYAAAFVQGKRVMEDCALPLADLLDRVPKHTLFVGDGVPVHQQAIRRALGEGAVFSYDVLRASWAARLAIANPQGWVKPAQLQPLYLRAPQAERERAAREAQSGQG